MVAWECRRKSFTQSYAEGTAELRREDREGRGARVSRRATQRGPQSYAEKTEKDAEQEFRAELRRGDRRVTQRRPGKRVPRESFTRRYAEKTGKDTEQEFHAEKAGRGLAERRAGKIS
jgi:hypothetical protein